jgi:hypothetical protein
VTADRIGSKRRHTGVVASHSGCEESAEVGSVVEGEL